MFIPIIQCEKIIGKGGLIGKVSLCLFVLQFLKVRREKLKKKWIFMPMFVLLVFFAFETKPVSAMITSQIFYSQEDPELGKKVYASVFEINSGEKYAYCIQRSKITPADGSMTSDWIEVVNENLRKVLYYGYGGPADMGYTPVETSCAAAEANGDNETSIGRIVLEEIQELESPPTNFRVWIVRTNKGKTQDIAFYTTLTTGQLILQKVDKENPDLFLGGAIYGVYEDAECTVQIGEVVTDDSGKSQPIELPEGMYYLKELVAPEGYQINEEILEAKVPVERTITVTATDRMVLPTVEMKIKKQNVKGEPLAQAEFELFADENGDVLVAKGSTDENGELIFSELTEGTAYYLKETKAPEGYFLLDKVYEVVADGTVKTVVNEKIFVLPNTGSVSLITLELLGIWCFTKVRKKERRYEKKNI